MEVSIRKVLSGRHIKIFFSVYSDFPPHPLKIFSSHGQIYFDVRSRKLFKRLDNNLIS